MLFFYLKEHNFKKVLTELNDLSQDNKQQEAESKPPAVSVKDTLKVIMDPKTLKFIVLILTSSFIFCVYASFLTKLICNATAELEERFFNSLVWMTVAGVGQILGSTLTGKIIDLFNNRVGMYFSIICITITAISTCFVLDIGEYCNAWIVISFMWGISRTTIFTVLNWMWGFEFTNQVQAFGITKFFQQFTSGAILFFIAFIKEVDQVTEQKGYFIILWSLAIIAGIIMSTFPFSQKQRNVQKDIDIDESLLSS